MTKVFDCTTHGMDWTVEIEMNIPSSRSTFLEEKMKDAFAATPFVKPAAGILMIGKQPREIAAARKRGFNYRPRFKINSDPTFPVYVLDLSHNTPNRLLTH